MSNKRRREPVTVDTQLVEIYEDLANINDDIRLKAAQALLLRVALEADSTAQQVTEILRRLLRGLCSGRKAARLGFSVALTELLIQLFGSASRRVPGIPSIQELIETLKEQTRTQGNVSGEEERNHQLGRLFGAKALVKSGILFEPAVAIGSWSQILDLLFDLAQKRSSLREECGWILYGAVQDLGSKGRNVKYAQLIIGKLRENNFVKTPEGVAIWIKIQSEIQDVILPAGIWHNEDPLDRKEKARIAKILKEASTSNLEQTSNNSKPSQRGHWTANLHFAWDVVLSQLLKQDHTQHAKSSRRQNFEGFWEECVDKTLFSSSSSDERKYWGFLLFQRMLQDAPESLLLFLFTRNLMRCLMNQLASPERYLYRIAVTAMKVMVQRVQMEPSTAVAIIKGLLQPPQGRINFDQSTKTKTIEKVLSQVNKASLKQLLPVFRQLVLNPDAPDGKAASVARQVLADHLVFIVRLKQGVAEPLDFSAEVQSILAMFAEFAYFTVELDALSPEKGLETPVSSASREMFRSRISTCLTHLFNKSADPSYFTYNLVRDVRQREENDKRFKPLLDTDQNVHDSINRAWKTLDKLQSKEKKAQPNKKQVLQAFTLLYSLTIIQVYNGDIDAMNVLDELKDCYASLVKHRNKGKQKGSEALVEILLSFVAKPSMMFRRLAQQVFAACASDVNKSGLQSMIKVLETSESVSGQEEVFDRDDDEDAGDSFDIEEIEMTEAGFAQLQAEDEAGSDVSNVEESSNITSEEESDDDATDDELATFDAKLAQALGTKPPGEDQISNNSEESTDEDMNDEEMEALDAQLVVVFKERKKVTSKQSQKEDAKKTIINFKCRVLELLEIFVKQRHASTLALDLLLPLLRVIRNTASKLVSTKACDLVRNYARFCKGKNVPGGGSKEVLLELIHSIHSEVTMQGSNAFTNACSHASLLVARVLAAQDRENLRQITATYASTQERLLFDPRCKIKVSFFLDWLNWCAQARR